MIFHRLQNCLSERNYGCRLDQDTCFSANFQYIVAKMLCLRGSAPDPAEGLRRSRHPAGKRWVIPCRGPHIIADPRASTPHDPTLNLQRRLWQTLPKTLTHKQNRQIKPLKTATAAAREAYEPGSMLPGTL